MIRWIFLPGYGYDKMDFFAWLWLWVCIL